MVVEISAFGVHVHPLFVFVVGSIPRLHTAPYHLRNICILEIIEFAWEWDLIKNGGFDANEAGTLLTSPFLFWREAVHTNEQQESINGRSTRSALQMSRNRKSAKHHANGKCGGPSDLPRFPQEKLATHLF